MNEPLPRAFIRSVVGRMQIAGGGDLAAIVLDEALDELRLIIMARYQREKALTAKAEELAQGPE